MLLEGASRREIIAKMDEKYGIKKSQADNYIKKASKSFDKAVQDRAYDKLEYVSTRFNKIYEEAMAAGRYKEANDALANLAKFCGLEPIKKTQTDMNITENADLSNKSTAELLQLVQSNKEEG